MVSYFAQKVLAASRLWCRPGYNILKPRQDEKYPAGLVGGKRLRHPGYINYQKRMQSLGFYTSVKMLERAGACILCHFSSVLSGRPLRKTFDAQGIAGVLSCDFIEQVLVERALILSTK